jgi:hypothetical protein
MEQENFDSEQERDFELEQESVRNVIDQRRALLEEQEKLIDAKHIVSNQLIKKKTELGISNIIAGLREEQPNLYRYIFDLEIATANACEAKSICGQCKQLLSAQKMAEERAKTMTTETKTFIASKTHICDANTNVSANANTNVNASANANAKQYETNTDVIKRCEAILDAIKRAITEPQIIRQS